jgi:CHAD domain-containing protein
MQREKIGASKRMNGHRVPITGEALPALAPDTLSGLVLSLKKDWKCYRKLLRKCQQKFSERSVHDVRVSARRLLSLLDLLSGFLSPSCLEPAQTALKRQLDTFDDLRDTQVQLVTVRQLRKKFPAARRFHRFLKKREERQTRSTRKKARRLRSKPLGKLIEAARDDVRNWLRAEGPRRAGPLLLSAANRAFDLTRKAKSRIEPEDSHAIHCTRVAFKKFRYVVEALADHLPGLTQNMLKEMRGYQTLMGDIQDAQVLLRAFEKFLGQQKTKVQQAVRLEQELRERRHQLIARYLAAADRLMDFWPPHGSCVSSKPQRVPSNGTPAGLPHDKRSTRRSQTRPKNISL